MYKTNSIMKDLIKLFLKFNQKSQIYFMSWDKINTKFKKSNISLKV